MILWSFGGAGEVPPVEDPLEAFLSGSTAQAEAWARGYYAASFDAARVIRKHLLGGRKVAKEELRKAVLAALPGTEARESFRRAMERAAYRARQRASAR